MTPAYEFAKEIKEIGDQLGAAVLTKDYLKLTQAVIEVESAFVSLRTKYEPHYKYTIGIPDFAHKLGISESTEEVFQKVSWGLMQVMGGVAREYGFQGHLLELCSTPTYGLYFGMRHLFNYYKRYKNMPDAIAAYNAGSPRRIAGGGPYENQQYVDKVLAAFKRRTG